MFVEVMTQYNETQVSFREKSKSRIQRQLEISESLFALSTCSLYIYKPCFAIINIFIMLQSNDQCPKWLIIKIVDYSIDYYRKIISQIIQYFYKGTSLRE